MGAEIILIPPFSSPLPFLLPSNSLLTPSDPPLQVLLIFIRSMEEQRSFSIRDKSQVGSLLMVALHTRLDYATE